jgi:hypothetical protein
MTRRHLWALLALSLASAAYARPGFTQEERECFIDAAKVVDPPKFADFAVKTESVRPAAPLMNSRFARRFRTELRHQARHGPNFAGRFTIAGWGCGSSCFQFAIVDGRTRRVFGDRFPFVSAEHSKGLNNLAFRLDSRLIILTGALDAHESREGVHYAVWTGRSLKFIRFVPRSRVCSPDMG